MPQNLIGKYIRNQFSMKDKFGEGKSILLAMPDWFLYDTLKSQLESMGFRVIGIPFTGKFKYKNFGDRAVNFLRKVFLNDKNYKPYLKYRDTGFKITKAVEELDETVDYCLMLRADYYPMHIVKKIKSKSKVLVGYQWDGLDRFPGIKDLIFQFDRFFVFDPNDLNFPSVKPATNFYFQKDNHSKYKDIDVYYLGNYVRSRFKKLEKLSDFLKKIHSNSVIKIHTEKERVQRKIEQTSLELVKNYISYDENLELVNRSRIMVDLLHDVHKGLSFRVFEAIGNEKKLILDNAEILKYEFYDPANFFLVKDDNYEGLEEFIKTPYKPLPIHIKQKYSFENWIKYVLDIEPYQKIELPQ